METIKDRVYSLSKIKNISIPDLENKCGFGAGTIGKWDKSAPSALKLYEVSVVLETSMEYLLNGYDGMNPKVILKDAILREPYAEHEERVKENLAAMLGKTKEEVFTPKRNDNEEYLLNLYRNASDYAKGRVIGILEENQISKESSASAIS